MKKIFRLTLISVISVFTYSCNDTDTVETTVTPGTKIVLSRSQSETMNNVQTFSFKLIKAIDSLNGDENYIFSPISAAVELALVANGVSEEAQDEILDAFDLENDDLDQFNSLISTLAKELPNTVSSTSKLVLANSIWIDNNITYKSEYSDAMSALFDATIQKIDFKSPTSADIINDWCSKKTDGAINEMVTYNPLTELQLINAVYFKAKWLAEFDTSNTTPSKFNNIDGSQSTVEMMHGSQSINYYNGDNYEVFSIGYQDTNIQYMVILPNEGVAISDITDKISDALKDIILSTKTGTSEIYMPKVELNTEVNLSNAFDKLGIKTIFQEPNIFSKIIDSKISSLINITQKSKLSINEKETVAASATALSVYGSAGDKSIPSKIVVDRPYFFMIYDRKSTEAIIMEGKVTKL